MKLSAAACTSTSTSPGPGSGSASSPSLGGSMPSKRLQMTARISAEPVHAHGDHFGRRAIEPALAHAAGHHRLALAMLDDASAQLERALHRSGLEVREAEARGHD